MNANCLDCSANFLVTPDTVVSGACPHCGGKRLERDQPSPTHSDGELRNMINPDTGMDQGGNPLMEGVLGQGEGWQPYTRRDESFASTHEAAIPVGDMKCPLCHGTGAEPQYGAICPECHGSGALFIPRNADGPFYLPKDNGPDLADPEKYPPQDIAMRGPVEYGEDTEGNTMVEPMGIHRIPYSIDPRSLKGRLPPQVNYGSTMDHESRTLNMDPYDYIWGENPEPNIHVAGPLMGLAGGLLGGEALPFLMRGALMGTGSNLIGGLMGQGQQQQQGGPSIPPPRDLAQVSHVAAGEDGNIPVETPTSNPGYYHDDPQVIDQHEFDDQSTSPNQNNPEPSGEAGGAFTDVSNPGNDVAGTGVDKPGFNDDSPGLERARLLVPLLQHYHNSEESGANDPMIRELHELLEKEAPGYLDGVGPEHAHAYETWLAQQREPDAVHAKTADWSTVPDTRDVRDFSQPSFAPGMGLTQQPGGGLPGVGAQGKCPYCGGVQTADGSCPQCGAQAPLGGGQQTTMPQMQSHPGMSPAGVAPTQTVAPGGYRAHVAAGDTQGPQTPEQILAVQDYLHQNGRDQEIPLVKDQPFLFTRELAEIAQRANVAPQLPPGAAPAQPPMDPSAMMGQQAPGGMPPGMPPPMAHTAADSIARRCPLCNSGTTGVINHKGDNRCHSCSYVWNDPQMVMERMAAPMSPMTEDSSNVVDVPAADQQQMMDPEQEQDTSMTFQDVNGQQLIPGSQYEMHSSNYMVPDIVRVDQVKPDEIIVTTIGEFQGDPNAPDTPDAPKRQTGYQHPVSAQTVKEYGVTFQPMDANDSGAGDQSLQEYSDQSQGPVHTEPSAVQSNFQVEAYGGPMADIDPRGQFQIGEQVVYQSMGGASEQGTIVGFQASGYTPGDPFVQNRFGQVKAISRQDIQPAIQPANPLAVQPGNPLHANVEEEQPTDRCPVCTSSHVASLMSSPTKEFHECYRCGNSWETIAASVEAGPDPTRDWLMADDPDDDFFANFERVQAMQAAGEQSRDIQSIASNDSRYQAIKQRLNENKMAREAGRKFSPREQRDFIDERGSARNSDLLDLEDTHYSLKDDWETKGNAFNVPEEHLFMGL